MDRWGIVRVWLVSGEEEPIGVVYEGETAEADAIAEACIQNETEARCDIGFDTGFRYEARPMTSPRRPSRPPARQGAAA